mgnify:FL=1
MEELFKLEQEGYVRSFKHKTLPLTAFNYTPKTQFEKAFGDYPILRQCRGIVYDDNGVIVARPFNKFFNWEEHTASELPCMNDTVEITEKMDGSLIIVYKYNGQLMFNTRGSFNSNQALAAEQLFPQMGYSADWIESGKTYLFEYIGPENRIVVQYSEPKLIHLGIIDNETGKDLPRDTRFECVPVHEFNGGLFNHDMYELFSSMELKNKEGFVIRVVADEPRQNFRMKFKTESYKKLHAMVTGLTTVRIWEYMMLGHSFEDILSICPDEFNNWLLEVKNSIQAQYDQYLSDVYKAYEEVKCLPTRKEQAMYLMENFNHIKAPVFTLLDGREFGDHVWKLVKPEKTSPFLAQSVISDED